ncbi:hypothetical protein RIF29_15441 [Crotalaria pallida]|uniref:Uncharacterized protein n=1 Tax=Crotalaria pallida TaxID=3830 RepID=A0AAN9FFL7_CROPI
MGKKKGRPPRSPPASKTSDDRTLDPLLDFSSLGKEDLDKLDNLSSKQAADLLRNLEVIKTRLKGKDPVEPETSQIPETQLNENHDEHIRSPNKRVSALIQDIVDVEKFENEVPIINKQIQAEGSKIQHDNTVIVDDLETEGTWTQA